jgi:putative transcriptional regulator
VTGGADVVWSDDASTARDRRDATPVTAAAARQDEGVADAVLKGSLLVATPLLREPTFARTVVLLLEHSAAAGALGVVVNRPTTTRVAEVLTPVADLAGEPPLLFDGGPVGAGTAIAVGLPANGAPAQGWSPAAAPFVTVDLDHDPALLAASLQQLRVFAGYAGWSAGQLEGEIEEGAWYVVDALPLDPFSPVPSRLWPEVLRRQGWPLSLVASCPLDPSMN